MSIVLNATYLTKARYSVAFLCWKCCEIPISQATRPKYFAVLLPFSNDVRLCHVGQKS